MKAIKSLVVVIACLLIPALAGAGQSCCVKAKAAGKDCEHKCCVTAHKEKKACDKCQAEASCCDKAIAAAKACDHKCCVAATKEKKVCEKCNAPKKEKADK